jgi:hypothetical protein
MDLCVLNIALSDIPYLRRYGISLLYFQNSNIPVIPKLRFGNDYLHPCSELASVFTTVLEAGQLRLRSVSRLSSLSVAKGCNFFKQVATPELISDLLVTRIITSQ